jgi:hypothetical protein
MNINVYIERLILDGLPVTSLYSDQIREALGTELACLLEANGLSNSPANGAHANVRPRWSPIEFARKTYPATLGQEIARATHERLNDYDQR